MGNQTKMAQILKPNRSDNRGGYREKAGRKKLPYKQTQMGIRVPEEIFDKCVELCKIEIDLFLKKNHYI